MVVHIIDYHFGTVAVEEHYSMVGTGMDWAGTGMDWAGIGMD